MRSSLPLLAFLYPPIFALSTPQIHSKRAVTSSSKAGLAWPNGDADNMAQFLGTGKVSWYYTWSSWPTNQGNSLEFVPQLWGEKSVDDWEKNIEGEVKTRLDQDQIKAIIGFNEPQESGQSDMSPDDAKELWVKYLEPLRKQYGVRLGSPPTSAASNSKPWTQEFLTACGSDCNVDFITIHWYGVNATAFINYITDFHDTFQRPIWVSEWACHDFSGMVPQCTQAQANEFMDTTQKFMDKTDWVERYSWFGAMPDPVVSAVNSLLDRQGTITPLGKQYIGSISVDENDQETGGDESGGNSNSTTGYPQIGMGHSVLPPPIAFTTLGRATASLGIVITVAVLALY